MAAPRCLSFGGSFAQKQLCELLRCLLNRQKWNNNTAFFGTRASAMMRLSCRCGSGACAREDSFHPPQRLLLRCSLCASSTLNLRSLCAATLNRRCFKKKKNPHLENQLVSFPAAFPPQSLPSVPSPDFLAPPSSSSVLYLLYPLLSFSYFSSLSISLLYLSSLALSPPPLAVEPVGLQCDLLSCCCCS